MDRETTHRLRCLLGTIVGIPLVIAIAIPLYLSGTPNLSAQPMELTPISTQVAQVMATATSTAVIAPPEPTATESAPPEPTATRPPALPQNEAVVAVVNKLLEDQSGVFGIVIAQPGKDPEFSQNTDVPFLAASLYKLVLLADIYEGIQQGLISQDAELLLLEEYFPTVDEPEDSYFDLETSPETVPVSEALFAAGAYSSNVAARVLLTLTDEISLEATAREIGMSSTYFYVDPRDLPDWPPAPGPDDDPADLEEAVTFVEKMADEGPLMMTTPRDIATYFDKLLADEIIDAYVSEQILEILTQQAVDDRFPCFLPLGTDMAHKTGNLDHIVHDVGIIWSESGPMILVAMVEDPEDDGETKQVVQRLAYLAYTALDDPEAVLAIEPDAQCTAALESEFESTEETVEG